MTTSGTRLLRLDPRDDAQAGAAALAAALDDAEARRGDMIADTSFLRIEQPLRTGTPVDWLRAFAGIPRVYWSDREDAFELAGIGTAAASEGKDLAGLDDLRERVLAGEAGGRFRLVGTVRFDLDREPDPEWVSFNRARFVLPLVEMRREGDDVTLAVNMRVAEGMQSGWYDVQRRTARKALLQGAMPLRTPDTVTPHGEDDDPARWGERIGALLERIEDGSLSKAVLARRMSKVMELDPIDVLEMLRAEQPRAYHLLVQPAVGEAFVAASPERLYRRQGSRLETEALAGTRARTLEPVADAALADELSGCAKDRAEHALVRDHVVEALAPLADEVDAADSPAVRTLASLLHLHTPVVASLRAEVGDAQLLRALHPTPAVCGVPTERARAFLREVEPFDRGLYAGPIGCFGQDESEVAVALRCATLRGHWVQLFAGAGIVDGSDADTEWQETADKMKVLADALEAVDAR